MCLLLTTLFPNALSNACLISNWWHNNLFLVTNNCHYGKRILAKSYIHHYWFKITDENTRLYNHYLFDMVNHNKHITKFTQKKYMYTLYDYVHKMLYDMLNIWPHNSLKYNITHSSWMDEWNYITHIYTTPPIIHPSFIQISGLSQCPLGFPSLLIPL